MIHNDIQYWRHLQSLSHDSPDLPSPRVCRLLRRLFQRWQEKPRWLREEQVGHLFKHLPEDSAERRKLEAESPAVRKGLAVRRMLEILIDEKVAESAGTCEVDPDELIVGTMPPFSVGQGKEFVRYLTEEEELKAMLSFLNELSPMGHIVPDHGRVVKIGLRKLVAVCQERGNVAESVRERDFYRSVQLSLEAVIDFAAAYARKVTHVMHQLAADDPRRKDLAETAERLLRVPAEPAQSFHDAVQAIHIMHCALHWTVEVVPIGRLDQILAPFYELAPDRQKAQEILDCFWIKLDESVILNFRHAENRFTACDGVLTGYFGASNYDQGGLLNQWMQQVTIGGVLPDDAQTPKDACNTVTELCLESSRRLPLNSPTLDLRVHAGTPQPVLDLAARTLLSGGAHPVILSDECIVSALQKNSRGIIPLADARDYACDGCYETMVAGKSEFSFGFLFAPQLIEKALNRGAAIGGAGPVNLRGLKDSWRSPAAAEIRDWKEFCQILEKHIRLGCHRFFHSLLTFYGNKDTVCPSPLLSALIGGCLESGRDLVAGGATYHIFSPLLTGISTAVDSLYVIKTLVYEKRAFSLEELVTCLATNWGVSMLDQKGVRVPAHGPYVPADRIREIHELCCAQPKFGFGNAEVDELAWQLIEVFCDQVDDVLQDPVHAQSYQALKETWSRPGKPFDIVLAPGVGTFEQYVLVGSLLGASPDGRKAGDPVASDLSPAPLHASESPIPADATARHLRTGQITQAFASFGHSCMERLGDGGAVDYNIPEDFDPQALARLLGEFAKGNKGSVATFTVADPETFRKAQDSPEDYNLVRVRMGGWTEFFVTLFPAHQAQHSRRPLYTS